MRLATRQAAFLMPTKGGQIMSCEHKRLKSVNCVIYCAECGEKLPVDYLVGKSRIEEQKAAETPAEPQEKPIKKTTRKKVTK